MVIKYRLIYSLNNDNNILRKALSCKEVKSWYPDTANIFCKTLVVMEVKFEFSKNLVAAMEHNIFLFFKTLIIRYDRPHN